MTAHTPPGPILAALLKEARQEAYQRLMRQYPDLPPAVLARLADRNITMNAESHHAP